MDDVLVARDVSKALAVGRSGMFSLKSVSLTLSRGSMTALVGRSGSGKTTLVQILGLLMKPDSGSLEILGKDVTRLSQRDAAAFRAQHIGFVFQTFNLVPQLRAARNVMLSGSGTGRAARRRSEELLQRVGLADRADYRPDQLSGGEQQRVAFARALVNSPSLFLADEPTGNLDETNEDLIIEHLRDYAIDGHAVLVVTHSARVAARADRVLEIDSGHVSDEGAE